MLLFTNNPKFCFQKVYLFHFINRTSPLSTDDSDVISIIYNQQIIFFSIRFPMHIINSKIHKNWKQTNLKHIKKFLVYFQNHCSFHT